MAKAVKDAVPEPEIAPKRNCVTGGKGRGTRRRAISWGGRKVRKDPHGGQASRDEQEKTNAYNMRRIA